MKHGMFIVLFGMLLSQVSFAQVTNLYRMDCRFYGEEEEHHHRKHCVASATYSEDEASGVISDVRYGVACNDQTIFNNVGIPFAVTVNGVSESHMRPATADVPKVIILNLSDAFVNAGTYDAVIELASGRIEDGSCDILSLPAAP